MTIIRSSRLHRWLRRVARNTVKMENINYKLGMVALFGYCAIVRRVRLWVCIKRDECCGVVCRYPAWQGVCTTCTACRNHLYNLEVLMMGIIVPETRWADNKFAIKTILLHLVGFYYTHPRNIIIRLSVTIHWVLHTNKCTNCVSYISLKLYTLKHFHCSYMFR
jgi:hypothetical protein